MAPIHERIPVVLAPQDWAAWLDPRVGPAGAGGCCAASAVGVVRGLPGRSLVNNVRNDGPELLDPLPPPPVRS